MHPSSVSQLLLSVRIRTESLRQGLGIYSASVRLPNCPVPNLGIRRAERSASESASCLRDSLSRMSSHRSKRQIVRYARYARNPKKLISISSAISDTANISPWALFRFAIISFMHAVRSIARAFPLPFRQTTWGFSLGNVSQGGGPHSLGAGGDKTLICESASTGFAGPQTDRVSWGRCNCCGDEAVVYCETEGGPGYCYDCNGGVL